MKILVDTSVWVDFFTGRATWQVEALERFLHEDRDLCICGIVLTETLQGIRHDKDFKKTRDLFDALLYLPMDRSTHLLAAEMYRSLRRKGLTIRKSVDCLIAAVAIE